MFQRTGPKAFKKDLNNIIALMKHLGNPERDLACIHIAGTNGKGSTAHTLASILQEAGYKTGIYSSPHYKDFRERIKINGDFISEQAVSVFVESHKDFFSELMPSFFEITVAMAFWYFKKEKVDYAVIETGLGGRLDSTNIITPLLSIITNIGLDHTNFLGNTLELIAGEKAGIIKKEVPVLISEFHPETYSVFLEKAKECNSEIHFTNQNPNIQHKSDLEGVFQTKNINSAVKAAQILKMNGLNLCDEAVSNALLKVKENTGMIGRWEILSEQPKIIADSAHNPHGLKISLAEIKKQCKGKLHIVLGMVKDKDVEESLKLFPDTAAYYFCKADIPRGMDAEQFKSIAAKYNLIGEAYDSVMSAFTSAKAKALEEDLVYIGGSVFVVAEVL